MIFGVHTSTSGKRSKNAVRMEELEREQGEILDEASRQSIRLDVLDAQWQAHVENGWRHHGRRDDP